MKKEPFYLLVTAVIAFCLAGCNPYVQQLQQLDRSYAAGKVDPKTYAYTRQQLVQQNIAYCQQQVAVSEAMSEGLRAMTPPPAIYQPQFMQVGGNNTPQMQNFSGTVYGPNGQMSTYNGTSY
jgi:hypothetical protein